MRTLIVMSGRVGLNRAPRIGIVGTFDVENYGDLLFPLIAEAELTKRMGPVDLHRFSYHPRTAERWPYEVHSVADLPGAISGMDGLLVGGGFIIRFDKDVAPGYLPPPGIHHPCGYWLTPALLALQHDVPLVWNAPGMHCNEVPTWALPLVDSALQSSRYVAVRDELTREALARVTDAPITVTPDTGFGIGDLLEQTSLPLAGPTTDLGLSEPYIVVQACLSSERFVRFVRRNATRFDGHRFLALPMGPVLGDRNDLVADLPGVVMLPAWPHPLRVAELIQGAEAVVGHSYHMAITAFVSGVPVFTPEVFQLGKYSALANVETIYPLFGDGEPDIDQFLLRAHRKPTPPIELAPLLGRLSDHWDNVADAIAGARASTHEDLDRVWQMIPSYFEAEADRYLTATEACEANSIHQTARIAALDLESTRQEAAIDALESHVKRQAATIRALETNSTRQAGVLDAHEATATRQTAQIALLEEEAIRLVERIDELRRLTTVACDALLEREKTDATLHDSRSWKTTLPLRRVAQVVGRHRPARPILILSRLLQARLSFEPFEWCSFDQTFTGEDAELLAETFPRDHFKEVKAYGGEKDYEYEARELVPMGKETISHADALSESWRRLARELLSPAYRVAMSLLTGKDLMDAHLEVIAFHYGPGASLGAHQDLPEKLATHIMYFNPTWEPADGGCLSILGSSRPDDVVARVSPLLGSSAVIVRSDHSWHAVPRIASGSPTSRRSVTATFFRAGFASGIWSGGDDDALLHTYGVGPTRSRSAADG